MQQGLVAGLWPACQECAPLAQMSWVFVHIKTHCVKWKDRLGHAHPTPVMPGCAFLSLAFQATPVGADIT